MKLKPIGVVHSPYLKRGDAPFQGRMENLESRIEVFDEFVSALKDVEDFTHLFVFYWADRANRDTLQNNTPFDKDETVFHGVFSTRTPNRPNPISICIVDLVKRDGNVLCVRGLDAFDKSNVLDIKPYDAKLDAITDAKSTRFFNDKK